MCNPNDAGSLHQKKECHPRRQSCVFRRILLCSSRQLCILCFLLYYFAAGNYAHATNVTRQLVTTEKPKTADVECLGEACYLKISSNRQALEKMSAVSEHLFDSYATTNGSQKLIDQHGIEQFIADIGLVTEEHAGHDHEGHDHGGHDHEGHDHDHDDNIFDGVFDYYFGGLDLGEDNDTVSRKKRSEEDGDFPCYSSVEEFMRDYFYPSEPDQKIQLTLGDFISLAPRMLLDLKRPECRFKNEHEEEHEHEGEDETGIEHNTANIWLISLGSVVVISLVSLVAVLLIPLLRTSKVLNHLIAFFVALAVGTLVGDALLHLLPHASGDHDHSAHGHGGHVHLEEEDDHFASMWKGLVACGGIYVFFVLETVMGLVHKKKSSNKKQIRHDLCDAESPSASSPTHQTMAAARDGVVPSSPSDSLLLKPIKHHDQNGSGSMCNGSGSVCNGNSSDCHPGFTPTDEKNGEVTFDNRKPNDKHQVIEMNEEPLDTGHHHHHSHEIPQTITNLALMVIVGEGLHKVTDGLAIGAAFSGSISAGLSTALAILFHEIPQELGDFAVLLNAGMTVKRALLWNVIADCVCLVGVIIGLVITELTTGIVPWILAFTAGGFLYIALAVMLPTMVKQIQGTFYFTRFAIQNVGMLAGFGIMVLIALKEDSFFNFF